MVGESSSTVGRARILLIDDDPDSLTILGGLLHPHYEVLVAPSGARGLEIAATAQPPELILLDVMMPEMNGYDVLMQLRANPATRAIPVMFVTGLDSASAETRGFEVGAVDYIAKPFSAPVVLARVRTQLELKRARDRLTDQNSYLEAEVARRLKEAQAAQSQLLQSEKLAAIGLLAAGVTHEINTPLAFLKSNMATLRAYLGDLLELLAAYEALEDKHPENDPALAKVELLKQQKDTNALREDIAPLISESLEGLARISNIVSELKNFSRADSGQWEWTDLHTGLESTLHIVWNEIKYHCTLAKAYGKLPQVYCIPSQINQVFLALLINAAQAIPEKGEITISTGQSAREVFVAIADTGPGIPADTLPHLFEPFFTTKPVGTGTGLGLSIAYGIVQTHGGRIEVETTVGKGTTFTVWLPIDSKQEVNEGISA